MRRSNRGARTTGRVHAGFLLVGTLSIAAATVFGGWVVVRADRNLREQLLIQARLVARGVDAQRVKALAGGPSDLDSPDYRRLSGQLEAVRSANSRYRYVYLIGRRDDGTLFFHVDAQAPSDDDGPPSQPGDVYNDASEELRDIFRTGESLVEGPLPDEWGVWVSPLVPIMESDTGEVIAVLGIDIDAVAWKWDVASTAALPLALMLLLLIGGLAFILRRRVDASPRPVLWRLLPPISAIVVLLVLGAVILLWRQHQQRLADDIAARSDSVYRELHVDLANQAAKLSLASQLIAGDTNVRDALRLRDADTLSREWAPLFDRISHENDLEELAFLDTSRTCLVRIQDPEVRGDLVDLFTTREAERTGRTASGIVLLPSGRLAIRATQPVFHEGELAGYVEIGKQIEDVLESLQARTGVELAALVHKRLMDRASWMDARRTAGDEDEWDRLPEDVLLYTSMGRLPEVVADWLDHLTEEHLHGGAGHELRFDGRDWRVSAMPLRDAAGMQVGNLLILCDISAETQAFARLMTLGAAVGAVLLGVLLSFIYVLLRRTDIGIRTQQAHLRENEELLSATLRSIGDGVISCDIAGCVASLNAVAERLTGWSTAEAAGRPVEEVFHIIHGETRSEMESPLTQALQEDRPISLANQTVLVARDGREHRVADSCAPIHDPGGRVVGAVLVFRDVTREHQHREQLRASKARFDQLAELSGTIAWEVDAEGRYTYVSHVIEQVLGYSPDELVGQVFFYELHPEDGRDAFRRAAFEVFARHAEFRNVLNTVLTRDGQTRWFSTNGIPLLNPDGTLRGYRGSDTDVTDRRLAEEALLESEEKHRLLVEHAVSAVASHEIVLDEAGNPVDYVFLSANPAFETHTGLRAEDVVGKRVTELLPDMDQAPFIEVYGKVALTGESVSFEQFSEPLGRHYFVNAYPLGNGRFATVFTDITERKRADEALRESAARLRAITDSAQDAILMMDPQGIISYWNPAAETVFGYRADEALGRNLHDLLAPERYRGAFREAFPEFARTGGGNAIGRTLELAAVTKDRREIAVAVALSAVQLEGEWHAVGIIRDITERKQAEAEQRETNRQLEEATVRANEMAVQAEMANTAKSQFLANMSHEIRTPMNGVIGMTGLLLDTDLTDEQRHYAEVVRGAGESLLGLINDILDFSKIEAGKLDLEILDFDLASLLDDFVYNLAVRAHEKDLELLCVVDPDVPMLLQGDPGRLRQILTNLVGNAIKFTHEGEIAVRVSAASVTGSSVVLRFSVKDTGIGIPRDKLGLLFDQFSQVDASTTRRYGGTGLGLAISKQLAEIMGGEIGVISEESRGSEFWFTARLGVQSARPAVTATPPTDLRGVRALIVDDNATSREILVALLVSWGMRPAETESAPSALEALRSAATSHDPFRLAVIDMQMPYVDGADLGRSIKADPALAGTRLVMMTSLGSRGDARRFAEIGFAAYMTKPVRSHELKAVLSLALSDETAREPAAPIATRHSARETLRQFSGSKVRILLAEDNITNQQVALGILKRLGLRADPVANGVEVLKALEQVPYDLVLMDVQMPEMDGFEATARIRDLQTAVLNHRIPIIAMTAHAMRGDREKCLDAGMDDYVSKPVTPQALAEVLERWIPATEIAPGEPSPNAKPSQTRSDPTRPPVFNRTALLERLLGDEEMVVVILEGFVQDIPRQLGVLREALRTRDATAVERLAHTIKGAAANVGGETLSAAAFSMERAASGGDLDRAERFMAEIEAAFDNLRKAIDEG